MTKGQVVIERTFEASLEEVWDLWTTKDGIESWWGPDGFKVHVHELDLRPGGELLYAMTAIAPEMVTFMENAGMPSTTEARITYTEVEPPMRLSYLHLTDFIPGVEPYDVSTTIELHPAGLGVRMVVTFDAMHNDEWTQQARAGWESELGKLATSLVQSRSSVT